MSDARLNLYAAQLSVGNTGQLGMTHKDHHDGDGVKGQERARKDATRPSHAGESQADKAMMCTYLSLSLSTPLPMYKRRKKFVK